MSKLYIHQDLFACINIDVLLLALFEKFDYDFKS